VLRGIDPDAEHLQTSRCPGIARAYCISQVAHWLSHDPACIGVCVSGLLFSPFLFPVEKRLFEKRAFPGVPVSAVSSFGSCTSADP